MKVREVIRLIEQDGWFLVRTHGSHRQFHHPAKPGTVTIAGQPRVDMPKGTLNSVLKEAGLKQQSMRYAIVIEQEPNSFGAYVPDLPGCVAVAESKEEVVALIREAIELHLDDLRTRGQPVPKPTSTFEYVEVAA